MIKKFLFSSKFSTSSWIYCILLVVLNIQYSKVHLSVTKWFSVIYNLLVDSFNSEQGESYMNDIKLKMLSLPMFLVLLCFFRVLSNFFITILLLNWRNFESNYLFENWRFIKKVEGVSQRIQEDTIQVVKLILSLFFRIVISISRSLVHIPILIEYSKRVKGIPPFSDEFEYSLIAYLFMLVSILMLGVYFTSRKMSSKIMNKEIVEAEFRKQLILGEEGVPRLNLSLIENALVSELKLIHSDIYLYSLRYNLTNGSLSSMIEFLPTIILIPAIIRKDVTIGGRATIIRCFNTVASGITCFFLNWDDISELYTAISRLYKLESLINKCKDEPSTLLNEP
ncbi:uncharacterized protein cubi_02811 [Cryptosporidium ubiquitum]|uniref:SbmA/BacA-like family protein n=1 Tax=Cryptosporidium ubiquitum TaxID=857276 RepID=A0A1J4MIF3_9CRYT|nr:uncharacterized protein cubi_02811 [Cryptosporidium ubiquitum]OII74009.1 hypothetical protein cubi_02811 [Cryptosporidium ubiquitum]